MKTTGTAIDEVVAVIFNSCLRTAITGSIARRRPPNSDKEDIIVNSLGLSFSQIQRGIVNVNIHVPNIDFTANGVTDTEYPNYVRLKELTEIAIPVLKNYIGKGFYFQVQQQLDIKEAKSSFSNIRLSVQAKNI